MLGEPTWDLFPEDHYLNRTYYLLFNGFSVFPIDLYFVDTPVPENQRGILDMVHVFFYFLACNISNQFPDMRFSVNLSTDRIDNDN